MSDFIIFNEKERIDHLNKIRFMLYEILTRQASDADYGSLMLAYLALEKDILKRKIGENENN